MSCLDASWHAGLHNVQDALRNNSLSLEGCQLRCNGTTLTPCNGSSSSVEVNGRRNYCASPSHSPAQMRVSPDGGNIMLAGNGLQLNTAHGEGQLRQWKPPSDCRKLERQEREPPQTVVEEKLCAAETKHVGKLLDVRAA